MTINEGLTLMKAIRKRVANLEELRESVSNTTRYMGAQERVVTPKYDVKAVDQKIIELDKMLFLMDNAIKKQNAITEIKVVIDTDKIFESLA